MNKEDRKAALAAYRERKQWAGVFVLRSEQSGQTWVGHAPDVDLIWNRLTATLRAKQHRNAELQAAYNRHVAEDIRFEVVERLASEDLKFGGYRTLELRAQSWAEQLNAGRV